jgi:hypothetical protein
MLSGGLSAPFGTDPSRLLLDQRGFGNPSLSLSSPRIVEVVAPCLTPLPLPLPTLPLSSRTYPIISSGLYPLLIRVVLDSEVRRVAFVSTNLKSLVVQVDDQDGLKDGPLIIGSADIDQDEQEFLVTLTHRASSFWIKVVAGYGDFSVIHSIDVTS